ncbi:MAG: AmmeMemoRadiSam system protein A [Chlorobi bacterium]|nr:AmmeMemoRadiSam system protein A [Chlorobiota bacterium]
MELALEEKKILMEIARNSIKALFYDGVKPVDEKVIKQFPVLEKKAGAFVTLTEDKRLRGCIGYIIADRPLYKTIADAAVQAATNDPRFPELTKEEFDRIDLEISVLSEPFPIESYDDIIVGKHGLILTEGFHRGLLLPQVPIEHNMNKEQYLTSLCHKAGLHGNCWKEKQLNLEAFTANVFSENDLTEEEDDS